MAYTPTIWKDGQAPSINAENLNKMEEGIVNANTVSNQALEAATSAKYPTYLNIGSEQLGSGTSPAIFTNEKINANINVACAIIQNAEDSLYATVPLTSAEINVSQPISYCVYSVPANKFISGTLNVHFANGKITLGLGQARYIDPANGSATQYNKAITATVFIAQQ